MGDPQSFRHDEPEERAHRIKERMRREAHEELDKALNRREEWHYPLVVTVTVESPVVRRLRRPTTEEGDRE